MTAHLQQMFRYVAWANDRTLASVRATPAAHAEALPLLAHLFAAEHIWLARLEQRESRLAVWPMLELEECVQLASESATGYQAYLARTSESLLTEPLRYRTSQGVEFATPVFDILMQVLTHGPYHRGQIAKAIARAAGQPASTDYILFARENTALS